VNRVNRVGKYAASEDFDEIELLNMVYELTEKDRMLMWSEGYLDLVIEKLPVFARDILENRKKKWEDTKAFIQNELDRITSNPEFHMKVQGDRKEFALFVMEHYRAYQSLLFLIYEHKIKEVDVRKFVYRRRFGERKRFFT
jgi:hypothetical protein